MLMYGLRDKAFLHITDPVLCTAKEMAAHFNSSKQDAAESNDLLQRREMLN